MSLECACGSKFTESVTDHVLSNENSGECLAIVHVEGVSGMQTMKDLMERLRAEKPQTLAGRKVLSSVDYENDDTGLPKAQVLEYRLDGKAKLIVRPSGTEPKIKVYLSAVGKTKEEADAVIETMKRTANELMKA